jgi:glycosyltransferase involved in cell wall biosynthesis
MQTALPAPDVILTSMPTPDICSAARRIALRRNVPYVVDVRDLWPDVMPDFAPPWARAATRLVTSPMTFTNRRSFRAAAAIVGISEEYVDWGVALAGRRRTPRDRMFPHAYAPPAASEADVDAAMARWRVRLSSESQVCLFLGTLSRKCDLTTVIRAARQLSQDFPGKFEWVLCGDGPTRLELEKEAAGLSNIHFPGWVGGADLVALLRLASLGLAPYAVGMKMSLPNKPFEYAWAGLPVVSSLEGELAMLIERRGFGASYRADDAGALARILLRYADDRALRLGHGAAARRLWEMEFSAPAVYDRMADFLIDIAEGGTAGGTTKNI